MPKHTNTVEHEQYVLGGAARIGLGDDVIEVTQGGRHLYSGRRTALVRIPWPGSIRVPVRGPQRARMKYASWMPTRPHGDHRMAFDSPTRGGHRIGHQDS